MTKRGFLGVAMLFGVGLSAVPAAAETLACPDLRGARQVASCPTEAELRYTFVGYCSDNARMYDGKADACTDFATYRKVKEHRAVGIGGRRVRRVSVVRARARGDLRGEAGANRGAEQGRPHPRRSAISATASGSRTAREPSAASRGPVSATRPRAVARAAGSAPAPRAPGWSDDPAEAARRRRRGRPPIDHIMMR